jgi:peroxiredoxin family protein
MPPPETGPDKLSVVVYSGAFDRVHYALVLASGAAAVGRAATLFFTMGATRALLASEPGAEPPWRAMPVDRDSGLDAADGGALDDRFKARGVAHFEELLEACLALGVKIMVCEMGLRAMGLERRALRPDVAVETGGVVTFLDDASPKGAVVFV